MSLSGQQAWLGHGSWHNSPPLPFFAVWREIPAGLVVPWPLPAWEHEPLARLRLSLLLWLLPRGQLVERVQLRFPPAPAPCGLARLIPPQLVVALPPLPRPHLWLKPCESSFRLFSGAREGAGLGSSPGARAIAVLSVPNYKPGVAKLLPSPPRCCSVVQLLVGAA